MTIMLHIVFSLAYCSVVVYGTADIDCNDGGFYIRADPRSRTHFYKCDNGVPVRFKCPDSLCFNRKLHVCDWPKNVDETEKGTSSNSMQQYSGNNGNPANTIVDGNNNKKPSNNELQCTGNNQKPSNNEAQFTFNNDKASNEKDQTTGTNQKISSNPHQQNNKPTNPTTGQTSGISTTGGGSEIPWHYQSYGTDDADLYAVQIIDNNLNLDGLGYKES